MTNEVPVSDQDQTDFWNSAVEKKYLNMEQVEKFGVKAVKLLGFKEYHHDTEGGKDGLIYVVEVLTGQLKGKQKELTIWDKKAVKLAAEFGTKDINAWVGQILTISIEGAGQYRGVKLGKYEKLDVGGAAPGQPVTVIPSKKEEDAAAFL